MRNDFDEISVKETKELTKEQLSNIGKKLKNLRVSNGLSLNDVSFYIYSNTKTVDDIELGKLNNITLLTLMKFVSFYKIPLSDLFAAFN